MRKHNRAAVVLVSLALALIAAVLLACALGAVSIPPLDIIKMTLNKIHFSNFQATWQPADETIIFQIRLIRVIAAALVGAALATAGVLFQGLLRNPMADPYITGTSGGAALGATIAMMLPLGLAFSGLDRKSVV
jgi:iron complex transport system permease protein